MPNMDTFKPAPPTGGAPHSDWYVRAQPRPAGPRITYAVTHYYNDTDLLLESDLIGPVMLRSAVPVAP